MLLNHAGVTFVDHRITKDEWLNELKPKFPPGGLPCWEEDGWQMNETNALMRYLGKRFGFHSQEPRKAQEIDAAFDLVYANYFGRAREVEVAREMSRKLGDMLLKHRQKFLCGPKVTTVDFLVASIAFSSWR